MVTYYGEGVGGRLQNGRGTCEVAPLRKWGGGGGGAEQVLTMLKGGHNKCLGSFYAVA